MVLRVSKPVSRLFDLHGRTALVTGGSRGLGLQVAEALGEAGASVLLTSRNSADLEVTAGLLEQRGIEAHWIAADAGATGEVTRVCREAIERLGHVDILVNNAGATWGAPAEDYPIEAWDKVMNLNVRSAFLFSQFVAKHSMIGRHSGRILMIASFAAFAGVTSGREAVAYNTSKAALVNLTRALAGEWGEFGITVNAIAPGWFPSKMSNATLDSIGMDNLLARTPLRRLGDDEDLKGVALLFASEAGKHITGQVLAVDGGASAVNG
jgi:gluconate 5-dehydrogenase